MSDSELTELEARQKDLKHLTRTLEDLLTLLSEEELIRLCRRAQKYGRYRLCEILSDEAQKRQ